MATYLTVDLFKDLTTIPAGHVDDVEVRAPGWTQRQLDYWARWIDSRLRKRYVTPFAAHDATVPTPAAIQGWLTRIVTERVMMKRGVDPSDLQYESLKADHDAAKLEILEAANSDEGWFDLPVRTDEDASGISKGGPFGYSEQSPYVWMDNQESIGRSEDQSGGGSYG